MTAGGLERPTPIPGPLSVRVDDYDLVRRGQDLAQALRARPSLAWEDFWDKIWEVGVDDDTAYVLGRSAGSVRLQAQGPQVCWEAELAASSGASHGSLAVGQGHVVASYQLRPYLWAVDVFDARSGRRVTSSHHECADVELLFALGLLVLYLCAGDASVLLAIDVASWSLRWKAPTPRNPCCLRYALSFNAAGVAVAGRLSGPEDTRATLAMFDARTGQQTADLLYGCEVGVLGIGSAADLFVVPFQSGDEIEWQTEFTDAGTPFFVSKRRADTVLVTTALGVEVARWTAQDLGAEEVLKAMRTTPPVAVLETDAGLCGIDPASGDIVWSCSWACGADAAGDLVVVSDDQGHVVFLDAATGAALHDLGAHRQGVWFAPASARLAVVHDDTQVSAITLPVVP